MPAQALEEPKASQTAEPEGNAAAESTPPVEETSETSMVEQILAQVAQKKGEQKAVSDEQAEPIQADDADSDAEPDTDSGDETADSAEPESEPDEIPSDMIARAAQFGMSPEDCADLGSAAAVERAMSLIYRTWQTAHNSNSQRTDSTPADKKPGEPDDVDMILKEIEDSGIDEGHAARLRKLIKTLQKNESAVSEKVQHLEQTVMQLTASERKRNQDDFVRECDRIFIKLGKEHPEVFGKGKYAELSSKKLRKNRDDVVTLAVKIINAQNGTLADLKEHVEAVTAVKFKKEIQEKLRKQAMREATNERKQLIPSPQSRQPGATATDPFRASVAAAKDIALKAGYKK